MTQQHCPRAADFLAAIRAARDFIISGGDEAMWLAAFDEACELNEWDKEYPLSKEAQEALARARRAVAKLRAGEKQ